MGGSPNDKDFIYDDVPEEFAGDGESTAVENPAGKPSAVKATDDATQTDEHRHSSLITHHSSLSLAVCLVSGGMDSCVTAAIAREENDELAFLHVSYGQRTEARERRAFEELADFYGVRRRLVVSLEHLARIGGSSLTDPSIPVSEADLASRLIPTSYVPFRNAHLLAAATSWAEVNGARRIYIGAVAEDSSGYPDCRTEFYEAFQRVIDVGTRPETRLEIRTPVIGMSKSEIIRRGVELGAPLRLTWSCYRAEDSACGRCDSCALRLRAFREAGMEDPIPYA
ncbi:MAG: 7-cyano-7-deazaguanine synthase [Acidobacteriota bacterium]|jgi:7-cyano-7-deazaguanine synthase|nr:7-cyano-7-deazaguanine synthase [Acidobacteriota bacterium]